MSDFGDDSFDALDDDALLQAAAQAEAAPVVGTTFNHNFDASPRPHKRRKLSLDGHRHGSYRPGPSEDQMIAETSDAEVECGIDEHHPLPVIAVSQLRDPYDYEQDLADLPSDAFRTSPDPESVEITSWYQIPRAPLQNLRQTTLFGRDAAPNSEAQKAPQRRAFPLANRDEPLTHHQLDLEQAKIWIYPTNIGKIRQYQYNIVLRGLFHNLLVALPTGLGKTFIAATVMLNWYRWTKDAKIIFVAPTKPLVNQQIHACAQITGIPYSDMAVLTGNVHKTVRQDEWESKRVFFMTPQTLQSDLGGCVDPKRIVLLVVDEAHRAKGQYAYVQVVQKIRLVNQSFRILALTATPGADVKAVQEVINGLDISRVEIRTDQSLDLREYIHDRDVETQVFQNSDEMAYIMDLYSKAVTPLMGAIDGQLPTWMKDPLSLTPYGCNQAMREWSQSGAGRSAHQGVKGRVITIMSLLGGLAHGMDLLKYHSITAAWHKWKEFKDDNTTNPKSKSTWKEKLFTNEHFRAMMDKLEFWNRNPDFIGHPKLDYLREVILNHLLDEQESRTRNGDSGPGATRIMVFSSFRDSAEYIAKVLSRTDPIIKPHVFVGQADGKNSKGMTQKKQLEVIEQFKEGTYNVLIATSIGEEGLDIGEVDLIVCYDSKSSPLRMLQRMGRTGRKRSGKVVMLQMSGKEENDWAKAKDSYQTMQKKIADGKEFTFHEDRSKRILPREIDPTVRICEVEIPVENSQVRELAPLPKRGKRKVTKKFHMPDGIETGFITAGTLTGKSREKKKVAEVASDEAEPIPALDSVCLTEEKILELQNSYQNHHYDDDDESAQLSRPALNKYPTYQRTLRPSRYVPHGRATKRFVETMQRVSAMDKYTTAEYELMLDKSLLASSPKASQALSSESTPLTPATSSKPKTPVPRKRKQAANRKQPASRANIQRTAHSFEAAEVSEGSVSSAPASDPYYTRPTQGIDLGSRDTPRSTLPAPQASDTEDSDLDGFVVPDSEVIAEEEAREEREDFESSLPDILAIRDNADYASRGAFPISTADDTGVSSSLPSLDVVTGRKPGRAKASPDKRVKPVGRRRRVVADSDDDDD